ncbi:hypothetical protein DY000_02002587 [Brassica cretica]|uniref:Pectinesterase n=1 Tax=Brassica cretica TaxID=69181 RepID=A0ABQ7C251_BRACR|nr:hypothetical protein DY000_02002587 [Brassica cretica]
MIGKVVVSVASVLLLVGVAIGVVVIINKNGNTPLSPQMKAVQGICQGTSDKASCVKTLEPVKSDDPNKLIKAFMLATQDALTKSSNFTGKTEGELGSSISPNNKAVLEYCKKVFLYALEDLGTILEEMGEDLNQIGSKIDQLKQWLTGVYNYQTDCLDDIQEDDLRKTIGEGIASSKILTGNAIDIFHTVVSAMAKLNVKVDDFKNMTSGVFSPSDKGAAPVNKETPPVVDTPVADPDAGPNGHQAVAIRVNGDRAVLFNCRFDGFQDTLYVNNGRQFYRNCVISGTVDFIFGKSATVIQNSLIVVRKGNKGQYNTVTADGNEKGLAMKIGIVLQHCRIVPDRKLAAERLTVESYLGRPWKQYSTTVIMNTEIGDLIRPEGWRVWDGENFHKSCRYVEYNNRGPGANTNRRVNWAKIARTAGEVNQFTVANWLSPVNWIQQANVPVTLGF